MAIATTVSTPLKSVCPVIPKTDGQFLILKRVPFSNGKKYDIFISKHQGGNPVSLDVEFGISALAEIQEITKEIFSRYVDPASQVIYESPPRERCDIVQEEGIREGSEEVLSRTRRIHELLSPGRIATEWSRDPNAQLIIRPERLPPERPKKSEEEPTLTLPQKPAMVDASTFTDLEPTISAELDHINPPSAFEGVTFSALEKYARNPISTAPDKLKRAYRAHEALVADPSCSDGDCKDMKKWLENLYLEAYQIRKNQEKFKKYFDTGTGDFDEFCRRSAAKKVAFIRVSKDVRPLIEELLKFKIN